MQGVFPKRVNKPLGLEGRLRKSRTDGKKVNYVDKLISITIQIIFYFSVNRDTDLKCLLSKFLC